MHKLKSKEIDWKASDKIDSHSVWVRSESRQWQQAWYDVDPGIITLDIVSSMKELGSAIRDLEARLDVPGLRRTKEAAHHLLTMCFKDGRTPSAIRPTADDGIVFYFYPIPGVPAIYACLELYDDGEVVAAWSDGYSDNAWDLGTKPDAKAISEALKELHAVVSTSDRGCP